MPTVGTCGSCGGPVRTPELWGGTIPPTPTCAQCGAIAATPYGAVMMMKLPYDQIKPRVMDKASNTGIERTPD